MAYISLVTVVVRDYDEAIDFYVRAARFRLIEDARLTEDKRWVVIAPPGARETGVLLAKPRPQIPVSAPGRRSNRGTRRPVPHHQESIATTGGCAPTESALPGHRVSSPTAPSSSSKTSRAIDGI